MLMILLMMILLTIIPLMMTTMLTMTPLCCCRDDGGQADAGDIDANFDGDSPPRPQVLGMGSLLGTPEGWWVF